MLFGISYFEICEIAFLKLRYVNWSDDQPNDPSDLIIIRTIRVNLTNTSNLRPFDSRYLSKTVREKNSPLMSSPYFFGRYRTAPNDMIITSRLSG